MPTYQYACTECDHAFEQVQSFTEDSLTVCPQCQGRLRKLFNAVGVVFKGSGFYRNDSRSTSTSSDAASTKSDAKSEGSSATKTETKSEKKSDTSSSSSSSSSNGSSSSKATTSSS